MDSKRRARPTPPTERRSPPPQELPRNQRELDRYADRLLADLFPSPPPRRQ